MRISFLSSVAVLAFTASGSFAQQPSSSSQPQTVPTVSEQIQHLQDQLNQHRHLIEQQQNQIEELKKQMQQQGPPAERLSQATMQEGATPIVPVPASGVEAKNSPPSETRPVTASRIAIGSRGFLEFHGLLQAWFSGSLDDRNPFVTPGSSNSTFLIRRSELKFAGNIVPQIGFEVMIDPSRVLEFGSKQIPGIVEPVLQPLSGVSILRDAFLTLRYTPGAEISIGQGKLPISYEGLTSSSNLLFVERASVSGTFGDQRDIGAWIHNRFKRFRYHAGIYNGTGASNLGSAINKNFAGRVEFSPRSGLWFGSSVLRTLAGNGAGTRTLAGGDVAFERNRLTAQSEFYWNKRFSNDPAAKETRQLGAYASAGYKLGHLFGDWQAAARFDWFNPSQGTAGSGYTRVTGGLNLFLDESHAKLQFNYTHTQGKVPGGNPGSLANVNNDVVLVNAQVAF